MPSVLFLAGFKSESISKQFIVNLKIFTFQFNISNNLEAKKDLNLESKVTMPESKLAKGYELLYSICLRFYRSGEVYYIIPSISVFVEAGFE